MRPWNWIAIPLLLVALAACAPSATVLSPPTFEDPAVSLVRLDPPGVGSAGLVLAVDVTIRNPNPVGVRLADVGFDLTLDGTRVASSSLPSGLDVPARGARPVRLEVVAPWDGAPDLVASVAGYVGGAPLGYRIDASVTVDLFGAPQRFGGLRVAEGTLPPPSWTRPLVRFDPDGARLALDGATLVIEAGVLVENPGPIGAVVRSPRLAIRLDGQQVGGVEVPHTAVAANGEARIPVQLRIGVTELGAALAARIAGGVGTIDLALAGSWSFEIAGVTLGTLSDWTASGGLR